MKNTLLKYDIDEVEIDIGLSETFNVQSYKSKDINIFNLEDIGNLLAVYTSESNDKLERISFELYGREDYWDIILMLNDKNPLFDMPHEDSLVIKNAEDKIREYQNLIFSHAPLLQSRADFMLEIVRSELQDVNEKNRYIVVVKPSEINNFLTVLTENNYL